MIEILAGDFRANRLGYVLGKSILLPPPGSWIRLERLALGNITELRVINEDNIKTIAGTVGWGAAGALMLGPAGLLAGLLLGGKKKHIAFFCKFSDGRKFMAKAEPVFFEAIQRHTIHLM